MKKKIKVALLVLTVLLTVYSGVAFLLLRGLGAYRISTGLGRVLSVSWQYTALGAFFLWILLIVAGWRKKSKKQKLVPASGEQGKNPVPAAGKKIPPTKGEQKNPPPAVEKKKIPPAKGIGAPAPQKPQETVLQASGLTNQTQLQDQTVLLEKQPVTPAETVLLKEEDQTISTGNAVVSQTEAPAPAMTVLLTSSEEAKVETNISANQTVLLTQEELNVITPAFMGEDTLLLEESEVSSTDKTKLIAPEQPVKEETLNQSESVEPEVSPVPENEDAGLSTVLVTDEETLWENPQNIPQQFFAPTDGGNQQSAGVEMGEEEQVLAPKTEMKPGICPSCGAELMSGRKFCIKCGYRIGGGA